jgi:hypothetical protein
LRAEKKAPATGPELLLLSGLAALKKLELEAYAYSDGAA